MILRGNCLLRSYWINKHEINLGFFYVVPNLLSTSLSICGLVKNIDKSILKQLRALDIMTFKQKKYINVLL